MFAVVLVLLFILLILLLSVGVVLCSPLPLSTHRTASDQGQNGEQPQPPTSLSSLEELKPSQLFNPASPPLSSVQERNQPISRVPTVPTEQRDRPVVRIIESSKQEPSVSDILDREEGSFLTSDYSLGRQNDNRNSRSFFGSVRPLQRPIKDAHVTSEVRTVALQIAERLPRNSFLPPLVFAQQSSEISLEPTEVEAPGTTPTTVAMVTEPVVIATEYASKTFQKKVLEPTQPVESNKELHQRHLVSKDADQILLKFNETKSSMNKKTNSSMPNEKKSRTSDQPLHVVKTMNKSISNLNPNKETSVALYDLPQKDEPTNILNKKTYKNRRQIHSEFKIKAINNTYTLVHEKTYKHSKSPNFTTEGDRSKRISLDSDHKQILVDDKGEADVVKELKTYKEASSEKAFNKQNGHRKSYSVPKSSFRESKRIVPETQTLLNVSSQRNSFQPQTSENKDSVDGAQPLEIVKKNVDSLQEEDTATVLSDNEDSNKENVGVVSETITTLTEKLETTTKESYEFQKVEKFVKSDDSSEKINAGNSNIETREVDNELFFTSMAKIEKKDDTRETTSQSKTPDESPYQRGVITSSSEVSYKQFDPVKNVSQVDNTSGTSKTTNVSSNQGGNKTKSKTLKSDDVHAGSLQEHQKSTPPNSTKATNGRVKGLPATATIDIPEEETKHESTSSEDTKVTSLPSQTSVVEPLRTNVSSSLAEVTLPSSHHRTKSDHNVNSHSVSSPIASDVIGPYPLGGPYRQQPSQQWETSQTPLVKQEKLSVPVSEHVDQSISSGCVAAIVFGVLLSMAIVGGAAAYFVHQRLEGFRPKILSSDRSCANSDSGGYLDDQCRVAYVNSQIDLPKSTPEDLVSLDNDSFLNSLESMTIQNLWTDSIRHTKL